MTRKLAAKHGAPNGRQRPRPAAPQVARAPGRIVDTLASSEVFDLPPSQILREPADPEGLRIGDAVADAVLAELEREERVRPRPA